MGTVSTDHAMSERNAETIFNEALAMPSAAERAGYLSGACGADADLRAKVERLLQAHERSGGFLPSEPGDVATVLAPLPLSEGPGSVIGRYRLLQQIGEGGMGVVYMAEQEHPVRRKVALKVIKLGMDTRQVIARFEAERQALALMDHPNIAKVLDAGSTESSAGCQPARSPTASQRTLEPSSALDGANAPQAGSPALPQTDNLRQELTTGTGRPYFVMELVRGVPITEYCDKNRLSSRARLALFLPVCHAIQHAHQKGIIHRDIKPSNVLVTLHDGQPVPVVIDFGVAKAINQKLTEKTLFTQFAAMIGTPAYMSPEQAEMSKLDIDTRSDIYGLGVLLYELLTGSTPFPEKRLRSVGYGEMQRIIAEEEPERPSRRLSTMQAERRTVVARNRDADAGALGQLFRADLDWIVMKCLEKDRTRRYETADGLATDLQRHLDNQPVVARPPSAAYRVHKLARRHRLAFAAAGAVLCALALGAVVSTWQAIRATRAQRAALAAQAAEKVQRESAQQRQRQAEAERQRAEASERESQRHLYVANMNLAQQAWEQKNLVRVRELLAETATHPERGFEWYYWRRQTHLDPAVMTLRGHLGQVLAVACSPNGERVVTGGEDATARVWESASGEERFPLKGHNSPITCVAVSPDGQRIVTGGQDQTANVWEAATGKFLFALEGHSNQLTSVAFSPDGERIATGSLDRTAKVWDAASGKHLFDLREHSNRVNAVAFFPNGEQLVTCTGDYLAEANVWETASGRHLFRLLGHRNEIWSVAVSPDGQRLVTGSYDQTAKVWDVSRRECLFTLTGHSAGVSSVAFSPHARRIVTASLEGTAKLWDAATGKELLFLKGHSGGIRSVAFSRDGRRIVTGSDDGTARVWEAASEEQVMNWRKEAQAAAELAAVRERERAAAAERDRARRTQDPGAIKQWLVLLPILMKDRDLARALQEHQVAQESQLHPRADDRIEASQTDLVWRAVQLEDYRIDFNRLAGKVTEWSVAYAVAFIQSDADQRGVMLRVGSDDLSRIYLNGKLVYEHVSRREYRADQDTVTDLELSAGINLLVFKVVNGTRHWQGSIWLTDSDGKPLRGIRVTLNPDAKAPP
jgi:serine/threonine protein kinase